MVAVTEDQYRTATREQGLTDFRYGLESYGNEATIKNGGPIGAHTYTHLVSLSELIYFINLREQDYRFVIMIDRRLFDRWETVETNKSHRDRLQKGREWGEREREIERDKEKKRERRKDNKTHNQSIMSVACSTSHQHARQLKSQEHSFVANPCYLSTHQWLRWGGFFFFCEHKSRVLAQTWEIEPWSLNPL